MILAAEKIIFKDKQKRSVKLPGFGLQLDAMGWTIVVLIITAVVIGGIFVLRKSAKTASTQLELSHIQSAIMEYQGTRLDGKPPATLEVLLSDPSISSAESIDGLEHGAFLPMTNNRWSGGQVVDLWGTEYQYVVNSDNTGTVSSIGSGASISKSF
jgi:hypothetical protein